MKTNLFTLETSFGTFWIRPAPAGRVQLGIGRNRLKSYKSPSAAAREVAGHRTGWIEWDQSASEKTPADLRRWRRNATPATPPRRNRTAPSPRVE